MPEFAYDFIVIEPHFVVFVAVLGWSEDDSEVAAQRLLVNFGHFARHHYWSFTKYIAPFVERLANSVWRLEERTGMSGPRDHRQPDNAVFRPIWCKAEHGKWNQRKTGCNQRD